MVSQLSANYSQCGLGVVVSSRGSGYADGPAPTRRHCRAARTPLIALGVAHPRDSVAAACASRCATKAIVALWLITPHCLHNGQMVRDYPNRGDRADQPWHLRTLAELVWVLSPRVREVSTVLVIFEVKISRMTTWHDVQEQAAVVMQRREASTAWGRGRWVDVKRRGSHAGEWSLWTWEWAASSRIRAGRARCAGSKRVAHAADRSDGRAGRDDR